MNESPSTRHTKTAVLSLVGFAVGLHEVSSGVRYRLGEEDGSVGWGCGVAFKEVFVEVLLDGGGDKPLLGGLGAEGWTTWLEEEGRLVHLLLSAVRVWGLSGCISVGRTDCMALAQLSPHQVLPSMRGKWNKGEVASRLMSCYQNAMTSESNVVASRSETKAHAEHVRTGCPNIHGEVVIVCLHGETLSFELSKGGRNCMETLRGFLHCGLFTKDHRTGLAVSLNVKTSQLSVRLTLLRNS